MYTALLLTSSSKLTNFRVSTADSEHSNVLTKSRRSNKSVIVCWPAVNQTPTGTDSCYGDIVGTSNSCSSLKVINRRDCRKRPQ